MQRKKYLAPAFDLASDGYGEANGDFVQPIGARLVRLAALRSGDRVLDLGCRRGAVLFAARAAVGPDGYVVGVDLSAEMVHHTAAQVAVAGLRNVSVRVDDAEDLGFPNGSFEAVLSSLELVRTPNPAAALACVHRVLAPGGQFGYTAFAAGQADGWQDVVAILDPFLDPPLAPPAQGEGPDRARQSNLLADPDAAAAALAACGFTDVRAVEETVVTEYADAEAWWRALWAGSYQAVLETIPPTRREEARRAAFAAVAPLAEPDGRLARRTAIRYTTARRQP
jgi:ubiquinone/menaquinone biosynthesis C-methylase UbiE